MNRTNGDNPGLKLWYRSPAERWNEALPIGNGRLGGMVFGGERTERVQLNEDSLWSGKFRELNAPDALNHLAHARRLVADEKYVEAQRVVEKHMLGEWNESYIPLGDLLLELDHVGDITNYTRELDLERAVATVSYRCAGTDYRRELFASAPDSVIVVRLSASRPGNIGFTAKLSSPLRHNARADVETGRLTMEGRCPDHVEPNYAACDDPVRYDRGEGIAFAAMLDIVPEGGKLTLDSEGTTLAVSGADSVTLLFAASSDGRERRAGESAGADVPAARCRTSLEAARRLSYDLLMARHREEYRHLFGRVRIALHGPADGSGSDVLPTDERLARARGGEGEPGLSALLFQYGRYLLIASSRPGSEAANLQGIWNEEVRAPWSSNYTTNINTQMNYWPAEVCNLGECHEPLFDLIGDISRNGRDTARIHYGARGWTAHHNVDFWRTTVPAKGRACWSFWPMGGAWLSLHLWERYAFRPDPRFLADQAYPIMKEAARFCLDWLVEDAEGRLVTSPSTSPENEFAASEGGTSAVSAGSTMDLSIMRELFKRVREASLLLNSDDDLRNELALAEERLLPFRIGRHGQLQEWSVDFEETEPGHRHFSHLFGLFPGSLVAPREDAELAGAYRKALERRRDNSDGQYGWVGAWAVHFWARLGEGELAHMNASRLAEKMFPNLFNGFGVFQIDANFGLTSGIAEMLLQSHRGELDILPALPAAWPSGYVTGLRARGGYEVSLFWEAGRIQHVRVSADHGGTCRIHLGGIDIGGTRAEVNGEACEVRNVAPNVMELAMEQGNQYLIYV